MHEDAENFFKGKRSWSLIKDRILRSYIHPYIAKVATLRQPLLLIDAFAGPGKFDDGEPGSPLILSRAGKQHAEGTYRGIFINKSRSHHKTLESILAHGNWTSSKPMLGDSSKLLPDIAASLTSESVFLYLDPFGLSDCHFDSITPFLNRNKSYSTDIVINLCAPSLHRLSAYKAIKNGSPLTKYSRWHDILTRVCLQTKARARLRRASTWRHSWLLASHIE